MFFTTKPLQVGEMCFFLPLIRAKKNGQEEWFKSCLIHWPFPISPLKKRCLEPLRGSLNYLFLGNQTMQMYGKMEASPL